MTSFLPVETEDGTTPIEMMFHPSGERVCQSGERIGVSQERVSFNDAQREQAIQRAGRAVERHMADWERTGDFAARGDADRARRLMEMLIAGRSVAQVARMRIAQDLRIALEPGAERT